MNPYKKAIEHYGETAQKEKAIEEMKELINEIWHELEHGDDRRDEIISEIADVHNMLTSLIMIYKIDLDKLDDVLTEKMNRTMKRIEKESEASE